MKKLFLISLLTMFTALTVNAQWNIVNVESDELLDIQGHTKYSIETEDYAFLFLSTNSDSFSISFKGVQILNEIDKTYGCDYTSLVTFGIYDADNNLIKKGKINMHNLLKDGSPDILSSLTDNNRKLMETIIYNKTVKKYSSFELATNENLANQKKKEEDMAKTLFDLSEPLLNIQLDSQKEIIYHLLNNKGCVRFVVNTFGEGTKDIRIPCINN